MAYSVGSNYVNQATKMLDPSYQAQLKQLASNLNSNVANVEAQRGGINTNYDNEIKKQNLNNKVNQNQLVSNMLSRGWGDSTSMMGGLAEQGELNAQAKEGIESQRTGALNNLDDQKRVLNENYYNSVASAKAQELADAQQLGMQLYDKDLTQQWNQKNYDFQLQQLAAQKAYQAQQVALQRQAQSQDNAYKYAALAWQKEQANFDNQYKKDELAQRLKLAGMQYGEPMSLAGKTAMQDINAMLASDKYTPAQKNKYLDDYWNKYKGTDIGNWVSTVRNDFRITNPVEASVAKPTNPTSSSNWYDSIKSNPYGIDYMGNGIKGALTSLFPGVGLGMNALSALSNLYK